MPRERIDLTGQRYGRLVVIREDEPDGYIRRWLCRCDCGEETIARMPNLRSGKTTSCGCSQREISSSKNTRDLTGMTFGRLTVIERAKDRPGKSRHVYWLCQCSCGSDPVAVDGVRLTNGETASCGCLRSVKGIAVQQYNQDHMYRDGAFTPVLRSKTRSDNKTGIKGVSIRRRKDGSETYVARIKVKGRTYYLGDHPTIELAAAARHAGEEKYHKPYLEDVHD